MSKISLVGVLLFPSILCSYSEAATNFISSLETKDGKVYRNVSVIKTLPHGFQIEYPQSNGTKGTEVIRFTQFDGKELSKTDFLPPNSLRTQNGTTYWNAEIQKVTPDGLNIEYTPPSGGLGLAKVQFEDLSEELQKQYGFDHQKASDFRKSQGIANFNYANDLQARETEGKRRKAENYRAEVEENQRQEYLKIEKEKELRKIAAEKEQLEIRAKTQLQSDYLKTEAYRKKQNALIIYGPNGTAKETTKKLHPVDK
jgi:hypothetical protein